MEIPIKIDDLALPFIQLFLSFLLLLTAQLTFAVLSTGLDGDTPHKKSWIQHLPWFHGYPLVNKRNYGKSPFLMGKSTINGHFQ